MRAGGIFAAALALVVSAQPPAAAAKCGVERWPVKVGTDRGLGAGTTGPLSTSIAALAAVPAPANPDAQRETRFLPVELTVFSLAATMVLIKREADSDYHIVLRDGAATMIVEAPDPRCAVGSPLATQIGQVRAAIERQFGGPVTGRKAGLSIPVSVTGLGFFDKIHGQEGVARNGIELHPLLSIEFQGAQ